MEDIIFEFQSEYNKQLDAMLKQKLRKLELWAYHNDEMELSNILNNIDETNMEKLKTDLENKGYSLELKMGEPQPLQFKNSENSYKASIEIKEIKLIVRKIIIEV